MMEAQTRKSQAMQAKAHQAAREIQKQIVTSYREGFLDGSTNERQLMTGDLRDMLSNFSEKCELRAQTQETELNAIQDLDSPEVVENGDEGESGAFTKLAAKFAPDREPNIANIQQSGKQLDSAAKKSSRGGKSS